LSVPNHNPSTVNINRYIMGKGSDQQLYLFWYQGRGRMYASEYWNKIYLICDAFKEKRTDGALIRLNSKISGDSDGALKQEIQFINLFLSVLKEYIPE
jgi:EpsI family protein